MFEAALVVYYVLGCLYSMRALAKRTPQMWGSAALTLAIPFAGLALAIVVEIAARRPSSADTKRFSDVLELRSEWDALPLAVDVEKETNTIPLEEALLLDDVHVRRRFVLDLLKEESLDMVAYLFKAARNEDSETSHYAVTAILEMKRTMVNELQKRAVALEERSGDDEELLRFAETVRPYLRSGLMDVQMERTYRRLYAGVLDRLVERNDCDAKWHEERVDNELALQRYDRAVEAAERFVRTFPDQESSHYSALKVSYTLRSGERYASAMARLKSSSAKVSNRTLQAIRYWSSGQSH